MLTHSGQHRRRLSLRSRGALLLLAGAALLLAGAACFGDDDDDDAPLAASGSIVTVPAGSATPATSQSGTAGGTLVPAAPTATPVATTAVSAIVQVSDEVATLLDMVPCGDQAYYEVQTFGGGVPALTYKDVPQGTPIVFPFQEGRLRLADARAGAILLVYDVEGVGVFSVQAAGAETLDRLVAHPVAGTVIGHFGETFEKEATDAFEGYQLFAVAGSTELVTVGDQLYAGEALGLEVKDCVVLP